MNRQVITWLFGYILLSSSSPSAESESLLTPGPHLLCLCFPSSILGTLDSTQLLRFLTTHQEPGFLLLPVLGALSHSSPCL